MSVLVLDAGNSIIKAKIARRENSECSWGFEMNPKSVFFGSGFIFYLEISSNGSWEIVDRI